MIPLTGSSFTNNRNLIKMKMHAGPPSPAADSSLDDALRSAADDGSEDSCNFEDCSSGDGARTGAASPASTASTTASAAASPESECVNPLVRTDSAGRASGEDGDDVFDSAAEGEADAPGTPSTPVSPAGEARGRRGSSLGRTPPIRRGSKPSVPSSPLAAAPAPAPPPPPSLPAGTAAVDEADEDDGIVEFLDKSTDKAEARLAARRQARAEAREIRMRELERQQKELEENADKVYDMYPEQVSRPSRVATTMSTPRLSRESTNSYQSSRRSSEDSLEEGISLRDMRQELKEYEEKFRKAMVQNAQLDNEKASLTYQVELLKDRLDDLEEQHSQLQREHKEKCREHDQLKRAWDKLKEDMEWCKSQLEERDQLIQEAGLMIVGDTQVSSDEESSEEDDSGDKTQSKRPPKRALVSIENAELLQTAGEGTLDVRLRRFAEERNELLDQVRHLKLELEEERSRHKSDRLRPAGAGASMNGPDTDLVDIQREANKQLGDYKFRLQKAEQDVSTLQANVARLESQVIRYKSASESAEKVEDELKVEKRKLQRELREAQARVEELETSNNHLQRRLDKLKNAKSALLKEL
ncbi:Putative leucine-rich repeat flightless-interacting protein 2-like isoform x1 [Gryllus bimaculatus]|nr:Putative leucine-rich repeat flightless-interacting protein 2-like isoform x1 [Gryllus bimaculatus]